MKAKVIFTTLLIEKSPQALPLGAACVASAVKHDPLTADLCEVLLLPFNKEDSDFIKAAGPENTDSYENNAASYIAQKLLNQNPQIVGFSVFVWNRIILEKTAQILKSKGIKTLAGGPEITAHPEVFTDFDKVISGEGDFKVPAVIKELCGGQTPPKQIPPRHSPQQPQSSTSAQPPLQEQKITNKQPQLPAFSPYLDGTLDPAEYQGALWELARGCPFKCSYCYESKGEKSVRQFPMERIEKELDLFAQKKVPQVFVLDPTYNANKDIALNLIKLIAKKTPNTFYYFEARAEFIDRQLAQAFTRIPCALQIGLQTADENVARLVNRPFNRKIFTRNIGFLNQAGVTFGLDVIYGLPGESLSGFKNSIDFAIPLYPNNLELFCLSVLPGTDLYDRAESLHLTFEATPPYHIIKTDKISQKEIQQANKIAAACTCFYNDGRAVPWFNTICRSLRIKPSAFFERFAKFMEETSFNDKECSHIQIEKIQKEFITKLFTEKKLNRLLKAALDIITFNGAVSRRTDTGNPQKINLRYPAEYIDSEYSLDLEFFVNNVKMKPATITI